MGTRRLLWRSSAAPRHEAQVRDPPVWESCCTIEALLKLLH